MLANFSVEQSLMKARSHANKGEVAEAEKLYQTILHKFSNNIRAQQGLAALNKYKKNKITRNPPQEVVDHLINIYNQGQLKYAFTQAQALSERYPKTFIIWKLLGLSSVQIGMLEEAIDAFKKCILLKPDYIDTYINIGVAFKNQGKLDEAIEAYKKCILLKPDYAEAYSNMGNALKEQGRLDEAIKAYKKCISLKPDYAEAYSHMGAALNVQGKLDEAIETLKKAILLKPDYIDAYINIGVAFKYKNKFEEAIKAYYKCLTLKPDNAEVYSNMGTVFKEQGKLEEALNVYNKAISINPNYATAYSNMGNVLKQQGKLEEALSVYDKAISINPDYAKAYYNSSFIHNLKGNLQEGLKLYEWRLKNKDVNVRSPRKRLIWDGDRSLLGKNFLVYEEQGLGDVIQFCRYLPLLKQKGADVTFIVKQKMHALLKTLDAEIILVESVSDNNNIDFETALMSLPFLFNTNLETIPSRIPYLFADNDKVMSWSKYLKKPTFKIGICWQGSKNKIDFGRSFPLSLFKGISELPNVELISLHKGEGEDQIKDINFDLTTLRDNFDTGEDAFVDTAAVMVNCDLIITSDTATAHLAGALGCRTWVVLKNIPDWRWFLDRKDSPWYPSMTLYRQKYHGNWENIFETIQKDLLSILKQGMSRK